MPGPIQFEAMTEDALLLRFGERIEMKTNARVHAAAGILRAQWPELEIVPAYASLLLRFDPRQWPQRDGQSAHQRFGEAVLHLLGQLDDVPAVARRITIPVHYGSDTGLDLADVATLIGCSTDEVIARHCAVEYRVAMLGFAPGFPYLLGLDPRLAVPRRRDPRRRVPAGSVAIGGNQTGIYPAALPGGWQLIGRTPLRLFDVHATQPSLLLPGDRVRFQPIDAATFQQLAGETAR